MTDINDLLDRVGTEAEAAEKLNTPTGVGKHTNRAGSRVYSVRLPADLIDQIEFLADKTGVPAAVVVRGFVMDGIKARQDDSVEALAGRIESLSRQLQEALK